MTATPDEFDAAVVKQLEGPRGLFVGCGSGPAHWKYPEGPMSGPAGSEDVMGPGTAATPTVEAYKQWVLGLQSALRGKLWRLQVWNEGNLDVFYRGSPADLVELTFAAAEVLGRERVLAPSFTLISSESPSGGWYRGKNLTMAEYPRVYWRLLAKRAANRGEELPVAAATYNGYGGGATVEEAAEARLKGLRSFRNLVVRATGDPNIDFMDTEWNLRGPTPDLPGFPDTPRTARAWKQSVADGACLGFKRQFVYMWSDRPILTGWLAQGVQFTPDTTHVNQAFEQVNGRRVRCG